MDGSKTERWHNIPFPLTEALSTLTASLQKTNGRLDQLESEMTVSSSVTAQQSKQLRGLAVAVERLTVAVGEGERQTRAEVRELWNEFENQCPTSSKDDEGWRRRIEEKVVKLEKRCNDNVSMEPEGGNGSGDCESLCLRLAATVSELRRAVDCRPTKTEIEAVSTQKASLADVEALLSDKMDRQTINQMLLSKAEVAVVERLSAKVSSQTLTRDEARQVVRSELASLSSLLGQCEKECRTLRSDFAKLESRWVASGIDADGGDEVVEGRVTSGSSSPPQRLHTSYRCRRGGGGLLSASEVKEAARTVAEEVVVDVKRSQQASTAELVAEVEKKMAAECEALVERKSREILRGVDKRVGTAQAQAEETAAELVRVLNSKSYKSDVAKALRQKADSEAVVNQRLSLDALQAEVATALRAKAEVKTLEALRVGVEAEGVEMRSALSRTAQSLHGLLSDLTSFKSDIQAGFEAVQKRSSSGRQQETTLAMSRDAEIQKEWEAQRAALSAGLSSVQAQLSGKVERSVLVKAIEESSTTVLREAESRCVAHWETKQKPSLTMEHEKYQSIQKQLDFLKVMSEQATGKAKGEDMAVKFGASLKSLEDQVAAVATKMSQGTAARWLWRSGNTRKGNWVPWEVQAANPNPDLFVWKSESTTITATVPGESLQLLSQSQKFYDFSLVCCFKCFHRALSRGSGFLHSLPGDDPGLSQRRARPYTLPIFPSTLSGW
jgi:hypothetical protein